MHSWIDINKENLIHNFRTIQELCTPSEMMPILKSNAYGHGFSQVFECIKHEKFHWIGVNSLEEALQLRSLGWEKRILVMGPSLEENELVLAQEHSIDVVIGTQELWEIWKELPKKPSIHLKVDTGMCRQGFLPKHFQELTQELKDFVRELPIVGIMTHFADVEDNMDQEWAKQQWSSLMHSVQDFQSQTGVKPLVHSAATAAALVLPESRLDMCRIGIGLYGLWPGSQMPDSPLRQQLKPVLSWHSKLTTVKDVPENSYIGYGCTFKTRRSTRVGVVPIGYFEGYPRIASSGDVLVAGQRCQILGRICMNMMMVDLTDLKEQPQPGDTVTLIGSCGSETISAEEVAGHAHTIHYEIVTCIQQNIPRITSS